MNNNRGNNRRRGRGNNRQQGGGQQLNRIDSRARGNAPQMLEKYRKLAHDAHLNGDRVTEEYFLQFADHYFRVIADTRVRQDETRQRREDRPQDGSDNGDRDSYRDDADDAGDYGIDDGPYAVYDQQQSQPRRDRDEQPRRDRDEQSAQPRRDRDEQPRRDRDDRPRRDDRERAASAPAPAPQETAPAGEADESSEGGDASAPRSVYEPVENPFVRDNRARTPRPRREPREERRPRASTRAAAADPASAEGVNSQVEASTGLDPAALPPAISVPRSEDDAPVIATTEDGEAKPRRRTRRPRPPADDAGETLESVS